MTTWPDGSGGQVTAAGTYTWLAPNGVYVTEVQLWGGGGGGSSGGGGGGGGGEFSSNSSVSVTPGNTYTIIIGAAGAGGTGGTTLGIAGGAGGNSTFNSTTVVAIGGAGSPSGGSPGGAGGFTGGVGPTQWGGGAGGHGDVNTGGTAGLGGGGGGSAGPANSGNAGSAATTGTAGKGAAAVSGGGPGGNGGVTVNPGSAPASGPGGGGGGGGQSPGAHGLPLTEAGGAGFAGAGTLTWPTVFTVTFEPGNGSGSAGLTQSANTTENLESAAALGYSGTGTIQGWATSSGSITVAYANTAPYPFTSSITLWAIWQTTVDFNANGGTGSGSQTSSGSTGLTSLSTLGISRTGYTFVGWATTSTGFPTYLDTAAYPFSDGATDNLYAIWEQTLLLGASDLTAFNGGLTNNYLVFFQFTASTTGIINTIYIGMAAAGNVQVGIYTDNGSTYPGTLLNQVGSTAVSIGANAISIANTDVRSGTKYWLAFNSSVNDSVAGLNSGGTEVYYALTFGTTFPSTAAGGGSTLTFSVDMMGFGTVGIPSSTLMTLGVG